MISQLGDYRPEFGLFRVVKFRRLTPTEAE